MVEEFHCSRGEANSGKKVLRLVQRECLVKGMQAFWFNDILKRTTDPEISAEVDFGGLWFYGQCFRFLTCSWNSLPVVPFSEQTISRENPLIQVNFKESMQNNSRDWDVVLRILWRMANFIFVHTGIKRDLSVLFLTKWCVRLNRIRPLNLLPPLPSINRTSERSCRHFLSFSPAQDWFGSTLSEATWHSNAFSGPIHAGRGTWSAMPCEQMGPIDMNGGVHTARKQHQRKNVPICARVASRVLCGLGLNHRHLKHAVNILGVADW